MRDWIVVRRWSKYDRHFEQHTNESIPDRVLSQKDKVNIRQGAAIYLSTLGRIEVLMEIEWGRCDGGVGLSRNEG